LGGIFLLVMWLMSKDKICPHMQHVDSKDRCNRSTGQGEEKQSFGSRRECKKAELKPDLTERSESDNNFRIFLQSSCGVSNVEEQNHLLMLLGKNQNLPSNA